MLRFATSGWLVLWSFVVFSFVAISPELARAQSAEAPVASGTVGDGAQGGLAAADLGTGAAVSSVSIMLPSARGGLRPAVTGLGYNSRAGTSDAGEGWSLGLSSIERRNFSGPPLYDDPPAGTKIDPAKVDRMEFNGQPITPICTVGVSGSTCPAFEFMPSWANGWHYYRLVRDKSFVRLFWSPNGETWRIESKGGEIQEYGTPLVCTGIASNGTEREQTASGSASFPGGSGGGSAGTPVFRWRLVRQFTVQGGITTPSNPIVYQYEKRGTDDRAYLTDVFDTPKKDKQDSAADYAHHVQFEWEANGAPTGSPLAALPTVSHAPLWRSRPELRLARINVTSATLEGDSPREQTRRYHLGYQVQQHRSLLTSFQMEGRCTKANAEVVYQETKFRLPTGQNCPRLPAMTFTYSTPPSDLAVAELPIWRESGAARIFPHPPNLALVDINADGIPDLVESAPSPSDTQLQAWILRGGYDHPVLHPTRMDAPSGAANSLFSSTKGHTLPGPWTFDGRMSVRFAQTFVSATSPYQLLTIAQKDASTWSWVAGPSASVTIGVGGGTNAPAVVLLGDVDGDGLIDARVQETIEQADELRIWKHHFRFSERRVNGTSRAFVREARPENRSVGATKGRARLVDMDGDNVVDFASIDDASVFYYPGDTSGTFGCVRGTLCEKKVPSATTLGIRMPLPETLPANIASEKLLLVSIDGDDYPELIVENDTTIDVFPNVDGTRFGTKVSITHPRGPEAASLLVGDLDGNGTQDLLVATEKGAYRIGAASTSPATRVAGVLTDIDNGLGAHSHIQYASTADLESSAFIRKAPWTDHIPTVLHVVASVTTSDSLAPPYETKRTRSFTYKNPAFDGVERRFLGFEQVTETHEDAPAPAVTTETTFFYGDCHRVWGACDDNARVNDRTRVLAGVPVLTEIYETASKKKISKTHIGYALHELKANTGALLAGLDGRQVISAYPNVVDTFVYDTAVDQSAAGTETIKLREIESGNADRHDSKDREITILKGAVHLRVSHTENNEGNTDSATDYGCIANCPAGRVDDPLTTTTEWTRTFGTSVTTWVFRPKSKTLQAFAPKPGIPTGHSRTSSYQYDNAGNPTYIKSVLKGSGKLARWHEDTTKETAPTPASAASDGTVTIAHNEYDSFGNLEKSEGPDGACTKTAYDKAFSHLPSVSSVATKPGCTGLLATTTMFDRGLELATMSIAATGAVTYTDHDTFGRFTASYVPPPSSFLPDRTKPAAALAEYVPGPSGFQLVHSSRLMDASTYRETWSYVDAFGGVRLTLTPADRAAGDGGDWIASGLALRSSFGKVTTAYAPWFYTGKPDQHPIAEDPHRKVMGTATFDAFGRLVTTTGRDGKITSKHVYRALWTELWDAADLEAAGEHADTPSMHTFDGHGRTVRVVVQGKNGTAKKPETISTDFVFLAGGELAQVKKSHGGGSDTVVRWAKYDSFGRMVLNAEPNTSPNMPVNAPDGGIDAYDGLKLNRYVFSLSGALVGTSDARGCGKNIHYDAAQRQIAEDLSPCLSSQPDYTEVERTAGGDLTGNGTESFHVYDAPEPGQTGAFDDAVYKGRIASSSDRGTHARAVYDARGRVTVAAKQIAKPGEPAASLDSRYAPKWWSADSDYDEANRVERVSTGADVPALQVNGESNLRYTYSGRGIITHIGGSYGTLLKEAKVDAEGRPTLTTYGDGAGTHATLTYDPTTERLKTYELARSTMPVTGITGYTAPPTSPPSTLQTVLEHVTLGYDILGNVTSLTDGRDAGEWPDGAKPVDRAVEYDGFGRTKKVTYTHDDQQDSPFAAETARNDRTILPPRASVQRVKEQTFNFDWKGNTTESGDKDDAFFDRSLGVITNNEIAGHPHQLVKAIGASGNLAVHYDDAGNVVDLLVTRKDACVDPLGKCVHRFVFEWDEIGKLAGGRRWDYVTTPPTTEQYPSIPTATPAVRLAYTYSGGGRVLKEATDESGNRVFDVTIFPTLRLEHAPWLPGMLEYVANAQTEAVYLGGLGRVVDLPMSLAGGLTGGRRVFLTLGDHLGSLSTIIDKETGELAERVTYQAFGAVDTDYRPERWGSFREAFRFTGKADDAELGITYFGARYYHAALGRWMSPDPLTVHGFGADSNPYAYVGANVFNTVDPLGLMGKEGGTSSGGSEETRGNPGWQGGDGGFGQGVLKVWHGLRDYVFDPFFDGAWDVATSIVDGIAGWFAPTYSSGQRSDSFDASAGSPIAGAILHGNNAIANYFQSDDALKETQNQILIYTAVAVTGIMTGGLTSAWTAAGARALAFNGAVRVGTFITEMSLAEQGLAGAGLLKGGAYMMERATTSAGGQAVERVVAKEAAVVAEETAKEIATLVIDRAKTPNLAENIWHAQQAGHPNILTRMGPETKVLNRAAALEGDPRVPHVAPGILSRDEYPFASSLEGGAGSWVGHIPTAEQHAQGAIMVNFFRDYGIQVGDKFRVLVIGF